MDLEPDVLEVYSKKTQRVIGLFLEGQINLDECLSALDSALAAVDPMPTGEDLVALHVLVNQNRHLVMGTARRRGDIIPQ